MSNLHTAEKQLNVRLATPAKVAEASTTKPIRRLNRSEYRSRQLEYIVLMVDFDPTESFPAEDIGDID